VSRTSYGALRKRSDVAVAVTVGVLVGGGVAVTDGVVVGVGELVSVTVAGRGVGVVVRVSVGVDGSGVVVDVPVAVCGGGVAVDVAVSVNVGGGGVTVDEGGTRSVDVGGSVAVDVDTLVRVGVGCNGVVGVASGELVSLGVGGASVAVDVRVAAGGTVAVAGRCRASLSLHPTANVASSNSTAARAACFPLVNCRIAHIPLLGTDALQRYGQADAPDDARSFSCAWVRRQPCSRTLQSGAAATRLDARRIAGPRTVPCERRP
jgi:hypothetical protein